MARDANVNEIRSELDQLHRTRRDIERAIARKNAEVLKVLPAEYGFADMDSLIRALAEHASQALRDRLGPPAKALLGQGKGRRFSPDERIYARKEMEAGASNAAVARRLGASTATVAKWREKFGIKHKRKHRGKARTPVANSSTGQPSAVNGHDGRPV
jgi:hypothetical protein